MSEQPQGIDQQLDAGVAEEDHVERGATETLQPGTVTDPDDTDEAIRTATRRSTDPS